MQLLQVLHVLTHPHHFWKLEKSTLSWNLVIFPIKTWKTVLISPPSSLSSFAFSQYIVACFYSFRPKLLLRSVRGKKKRRSKAPLKNSPPPWQRVPSLLIEFSGFSAAARCDQIYFNSIRLFNEPKRVKFGIQEIPIFTKDFRMPHQPQQRVVLLITKQNKEGFLQSFKRSIAR